MHKGYSIRRNLYYDSVFLMQVAQSISEEDGVTQVAALMATENNKGLLAKMGFNNEDIRTANPNDLIIALTSESSAIVNQILQNLDTWLYRGPNAFKSTTVDTLGEALARLPQANMAVISVPGPFAAEEGRRALDRGLNVFMFSDNVTLKEEHSLKEYARDRGLIVMGPDCGTTIMSGIGIGFANKVRQGPIGIIAASGTGLQEITTLVHHLGSGISFALGTGGRDVSDEIGGISFLSALDSLEDDNKTKVIAVVTKPPGPKTLRLLIKRLNDCKKPVVACFLGVVTYPSDIELGFETVSDISLAAVKSVELATGKTPALMMAQPQDLESLLHEQLKSMKPEQRYLRGLFAGGTFCYQALQIIRGVDSGIYSNVTMDGIGELSDPSQSKRHSLVDMGDGVFTQGRPHPMIDATLRRARILEEAQDPSVAVLLIDIILGYNVSSNPAGDLADAISEAKTNVHNSGGFLSIVASYCGTADDPQNLDEQIRILEDVGSVVFPNSAMAAKFCRMLIKNLRMRESR